MASGLKVWDASGNLIVDTSTRLTRILGYTTLAAAPVGGTSTGSVTDDGFYTGTPFYVAHRTNSSGGAYDAATSQIEVSFSGNVMNLSTVNPVANYIIMYGVY